MKTKNTGLKVIYAAFIVVICLSWVFWFFLERYADTENNENRQMHEQPRLSLDTYKQFPAEYTAYLNDNIPFRNNLITLNNAIDYYVFGASPNDRVAIGEDGWLFYCDGNDGDPIGCYTGTNLLTDAELSQLAGNCIRQRDFLASMGIEFVIFIAPNKERVYYDRMPDRYGAPAEMYRTLQIVQYLRDNTDLRVVYPYEELMKAKDGLAEDIYYKTDTHWNAVGAYVGSGALLRELGLGLPDIASAAVSIRMTDHFAGDLAGFLGLKQQLFSTDRYYTVDGYDTHQAEDLGGEENGAYRYSAKDADPRKLYVIRDSFGRAMLPYLGSQFSESCFRHRISYSYNDLVSQKPDILVYETVERFAYNLAGFSVQQQ